MQFIISAYNESKESKIFDKMFLISMRQLEIRCIFWLELDAMILMNNVEDN